jgi:hypothetical protein
VKQWAVCIAICAAILSCNVGCHGFADAAGEFAATSAAVEAEIAKLPENDPLREEFERLKAKASPVTNYASLAAALAAIGYGLYQRRKAQQANPPATVAK